MPNQFSVKTEVIGYTAIIILLKWSFNDSNHTSLELLLIPEMYIILSLLMLLKKSSIDSPDVGILSFKSYSLIYITSPPPKTSKMIPCPY